MARDLTVDLLAQLQAGTLKPVLFYKGEFDSGGSPAYLRLWSGYGSIEWDSQTWEGSGNLLSVSGIEETVEGRSVGFQVRISGIKPENLAIALAADASQYRPAWVWIGAINSADALVDDPYLSRAGLLDTVDMDDAGETVSLIASYEDENAALLNPRLRRWTPEDQARTDASDRGFDDVAKLQDTVLQF